MVRSSLARALGLSGDIQVAGQCAQATEGWDFWRNDRVDVVVTDLELPGESGASLAIRILEACPSQAVLILSHRVQCGELRFLVEAGVRGYVTKCSSVEELALAIRTVAGGSSYLTAEVATALARSLRRAGEPGNPLGLKQTLILQLMSRGLTIREIAQEMELSPKTVEKYRSDIFRALNCRNQMEAVQAARRLNLVEDGGLTAARQSG